MRIRLIRFLGLEPTLLSLLHGLDRIVRKLSR